MDYKQQRWLQQPGGLAERLRQLQGRTPGVEFAQRSGMRPSKVTKLRRGQQLPTEDDLRAWVGAAGAGAETEQELLDILSEAERHHSSFASSLKDGQAEHQRTYNELVEQAGVIRMIERSFVPSIMQTRDYATAVLTASMKLHKTADDVTEAVDARMERQKFLYDDKYRFELVLDEAVLTRRVAPPEVMYAQVDRILGFMDRPNLRLGILPVYGDYHDVVRNSFELYGEIGVVETYYKDAEMDVDEWAAHTAAMADIWQDAVEGDDARALIRAAMKYHAQGMKKLRGGRTP